MIEVTMMIFVPHRPLTADFQKSRTYVHFTLVPERILSLPLN